MIAVISAGGKGTRLGNITAEIPKPMVLIKNKPLLEYQIECLKRNGIKHIYLLVGHLSQKIKDYFKDGAKFGVEIKYIEEQEPLGSAGGLFYLKETLKDDFILLFGDLMLDVNFYKMVTFHHEKKSKITLLTHPNSHPLDSDLIICDSDSRVTDLDSKSNIRNYDYNNLVNSGVYIVSGSILSDYFNVLGKKDLEKDVISIEIKNGSVYSYHSTEYVKDVGTPDRYNRVILDVDKGFVKRRNVSLPQKAVFLDRDGTINIQKGFIASKEDIELENEVIEGIKKINSSEYLCIIITNQPVVARGGATFSDIKNIHKRLETLLGNGGCYFDDIFFCPHHPNSGYDGEVRELKIDCGCRKPKIGLLLQAKEKYNLDLSNSIFVGDSTMDIQTGKNAGCKTVLVLTGNKGKDKIFDVKPDCIINNLSEIFS
jgi:D,D-heptose 1,7-bisphosphate phosphatase